MATNKRLKVGIIDADLSLHYFKKQDTEKIVKDLKRILCKNGYLIKDRNEENYVSLTYEDTLIIKDGQEQLDGLIAQLFDRTVNSIKKIKTKAGNRVRSIKINRKIIA